jgi:hypothetical protein
MQKDGVQSLTRLEKAKLKAALKTVENGTSSFAKERQKYEQRVINSVRMELCQVVADEGIVYKNVNIQTDDDACKKLAEAIDKIDPDILETLQSDPETYNQAIVDIHAITMMHGKPYGFSSKVKAINAKIQNHVANIETQELENFINTAYAEDQERLDTLKSLLEKAVEDNPDSEFQHINLGKAELIDVLHFLEGSDSKQITKLQKDKAGYHQALLEVASVVQSDQKDKVSTVQKIIHERVANPIDKRKGFLRKAFTLVTAPFKLKNILAASAIMLAGASTNAVDQDGGVAPISFADLESEISTAFTGDGITTPVEAMLVDAATVLSQVAADPSSVAPVDAVEAAALTADALDNGKLGSSPVGLETVKAEVITTTEPVTAARPKLSYQIQEAATQAYFDTGIVPASDANMAYLAFGTVEHLSYDGLHGTDGVAIDRGAKLAEASISLSSSAQDIVSLVQEANANGFTPLMIDQGQSLYNFVVNNPEVMAQIDATEGPNTREQKIMIAAVAIADANGGGNINELGTGEMKMIPRAETIDFASPVTNEMIARIRANNSAAGLKM